MFGRILGNIIAAPIRLLNVPVKIMDDITDPSTPYDRQRLKDRDPLGLDEVADSIADACDLDSDD